MKLSALKGKVRDLDVLVPGTDGEPDEIVKVKYQPGELTLEVSDQMNEAFRSDGDTSVVAMFLEKVLVEWDLEEDILDEDGNPTGETKPVPTTKAGIKKVPVPFLGLLMQAIGEDARPNPQTGESSRNGSLQEDSPDAAQSGTTSFGLPASTDVSPGT